MSIDQLTEKWIPILIEVEGVEKPPRYEVSNFGRIKSFQRCGSAGGWA